jgi:hypothetical protein
VEGSTNQAVPPPASSGFSNSNLTGTYVFSFSGFDMSSGNGAFFAVVGTLTANGSGGFTGGTMDIDDPALGGCRREAIFDEESITYSRGSVRNLLILRRGNFHPDRLLAAALQTSYVFTAVPTSGNYSVTKDGRGSGTISFTLKGTPVQFGLDFVLISGSHGLITRFDGNGTGSGAIDLQASGVAQSALQGSYAFGFNGVDSTAANSLSTVGSFTLDANGNVTAGSQDFNDNGNSTGLQSLPVQGTVSIGTPGPAQLTTSATGFGTLHFDVWAVDATHLKFIETDSVAYLEGDAVVSTGQTAFPSGALVFTLAGEDTAQGSFAAGGLLTSDGSSLITSGLEDVNDEGDVAQAPNITGSFSSSGARTVVTLNGIYNGYFVNNAAGTGNYTFAAYPYNGGVMLLEIDNGAGSSLGISQGNIYVQSATTLASSQGYGLNLSGANNNGEVDLIAEFTATGNTMSGLYDANNSGLLTANNSLGNGTYSVSSNGRGSAQFPSLQTNNNSVISALNLTFYIVNSSTVVFIEADGSQLATGAFELQNSSGTAMATQARFALTRPRSPAGRVLQLPKKM